MTNHTPTISFNFNFNCCPPCPPPEPNPKPENKITLVFGIGVVTEQPADTIKATRTPSVPTLPSGMGGHWALPEPTGDWKYVPRTNPPQSETQEMAFSQTITDSQQFNLSIASLKDKKGNTVTPSAAPVWNTDNSDILTLTPSPDGMKCGVVAKGALGTANVNVAVSTPAGDVAGLASITVVTGAPATVELTGDTPAEQP